MARQDLIRRPGAGGENRTVDPEKELKKTVDELREVETERAGLTVAPPEKNQSGAKPERTIASLQENIAIYEKLKARGVASDTEPTSVREARRQITEIQERMRPGQVKAYLSELLAKSTLGESERTQIMGDKYFLEKLIASGFVPGDHGKLHAALTAIVDRELGLLAVQFPKIKFDADGKPVVGLLGKLFGQTKQVKTSETYQIYKAYLDFRRQVFGDSAPAAQPAKSGVKPALVVGSALAAASGAAGLKAALESEPAIPVRLSDETVETRPAATNTPAAVEPGPNGEEIYVPFADTDETTVELGIDLSRPVDRTQPTGPRAPEAEEDRRPRGLDERATASGGKKYRFVIPAEPRPGLDGPPGVTAKKMAGHGASQATPGESIELEDPRASRAAVSEQTLAGGAKNARPGKGLDLEDPRAKRAAANENATAGGAAKAKPGKAVELDDPRSKRLQSDGQKNQAGLAEAQAMLDTVGRQTAAAINTARAVMDDATHAEAPTVEADYRIKDTRDVSAQGRAALDQARANYRPSVSAKTEIPVKLDRQPDGADKAADEELPAPEDNATASLRKTHGDRIESLRAARQQLDSVAEDMSRLCFSDSSFYGQDKLKLWKGLILEHLTGVMLQLPAERQTDMARQLAKAVRNVKGYSGSAARLASLVDNLEAVTGSLGSGTKDTYAKVRSGLLAE